MFYHFLAPDGGHAVSKSAANIYPSSKYEHFPVILLLTNQETLFNISIVLTFHPPFEPINALFTIIGLWPLAHLTQRFINYYKDNLRIWCMSMLKH